MAKVTLVFAALLIVLGLAGYLGTGSLHPTALIPAWFGLALGVFGFLAISPNEGRRKLFMHINVTIGAAGLSGRARAERCMCIRAARQAHRRMRLRWPRKLAMAALLLIYVILCVRSFIARGVREGLTNGDHAWRRMGMNMRAERSGHGRGARAGQADLPKKKPDLKKDLAAGPRAGGSAQGAAAGRHGADGCESRGRAGDAVSFQAAAG